MFGHWELLAIFIIHFLQMPPRRRSRSCFLCGKPGVREWLEKGREPRPVCHSCHFYRDNMTACQYRKKAKAIAEHQECPKPPPAGCQYAPQIYNKRRDSMRRSDIRHGCDPANTMSQRELINFVQEGGACHYCGACPTGIDRQAWEQCYTASNLGEFVPCCYQCNRMKRSKPMAAFIRHMKKVTCQNNGRVYACASLRRACKND